MSQKISLAPTSIGFLVYMLIISLTGAVLNLSIIIVYIRTFRQISSLYFITMLAFINFITSTVAIPLVIYIELDPAYSVTSSFLCGFSFFLRHFLALISIFVLLFIAYERLNVIRARTVKRLKIIEKSLIYNSRKSMFISSLFCFLYSAICFYLYETNCKPESTSFSIIYERLTICLGILVYSCMTYFYIRAYLIVYKSVKRCNRIGSRRNEQNETSQQMDNDIKIRNDIEIKNEHSQNGSVKANVFIVSTSFRVNTNQNKNVPITSNVSFKRKDWHVAKIFILVRILFLK